MPAQAQARGADRLLADQNHLLELMATGAPLPEVLERLMRSLEAQAPGMVCSVVMLDEDGIHVRHGAAPSLPEAFNRAVDGAAIGPAAGCCGTAMFRGEVVVATEIATDPLWDDYRHLGLPPEFRACWSTPIRARDGAVLGSFAMYYREPRGPSEGEAALCELATHLAGIAIESDRERQALRLEQERFRCVTLATRDAIYDWDLRLGTVWRNDAYQSLCSPGEPMMHVQAWWEECLHPQEREAVVASLQDALRQGEESWTHEYRLRRTDGGYASVVDRAHILRDESGQPLRVIGVITDVTEQQRAEAVRRDLEARLGQAQKMEAIGRLAGGVAHDFNNLLTAIIGYCGLLLSSPSPLQNWQRDLGEIVGAARRAAGLVRQLLAFSRRQILQPRVLDVNALLCGVARMLEPLIGEDVELAVELEPGAGCVSADPARLEQVIVNLALNARDAMPGGGRLTIRTAAAEVSADSLPAESELSTPGPYVVITVTDTGMGMDEATQARIFEPFFSTKPRGQGTGLGLATVYGTVKQSGGYIAVESALGRGTTFEIYMPRVEGSPTADLDSTGDFRRGRGETILLVEDDEIVRSVARAILEHHGYVVVPAAGPAAAIAAASRLSGRLDLILADVVMPAMSGKEMVARLALTHPAARVLYMSGYSNEAIVHGLVESGASLLSKPFTSRELIGKVREVLAAG